MQALNILIQYKNPSAEGISQTISAEYEHRLARKQHFYQYIKSGIYTQTEAWKHTFTHLQIYSDLGKMYNVKPENRTCL